MSLASASTAVTALGQSVQTSGGQPSPSPHEGPASTAAQSSHHASQLASSMFPTMTSCSAAAPIGRQVGFHDQPHVIFTSGIPSSGAGSKDSSGTRAAHAHASSSGPPLPEQTAGMMHAGARPADSYGSCTPSPNWRVDPEPPSHGPGRDLRCDGSVGVKNAVPTAQPVASPPQGGPFSCLQEFRSPVARQQQQQRQHFTPQPWNPVQPFGSEGSPWQGSPWVPPSRMHLQPQPPESPACCVQHPAAIPEVPLLPRPAGSDLVSVLVPYAAELIGTFTVILIIASCRKFYDPVWSPAAIGCAVMVVTYTTAPASYPAGMLNPAVTATLWLCGRLNARRTLQFASVQLFGGLAAGAVVDKMFSNGRGTVPWMAPSPSFGPGRPSAATSLLAANGFAEEVLYTALVCLTYVCCSISARNSPKDDANQFYGMGIGAMAAAGTYAAAPLSGAFLNPAAIVAFAPGYGVAAWGPGYVCAQLIGAALASSLFYYLRPEDRLFGSLMPEALTPHLFVPRLFTRMLSEFVGTFAVAVTACLCLAAKTAATPLAVGFALMAVHCSLANVSGGYHNPSSTLALTLPGPGKRLQAPLSILYILVQLAAGLLAGMWAGSAALSASERVDADDDPAHATTTTPSPWRSDVATPKDPLSAEVVFAFLAAGAALCVPGQSRPTLQGSFAAGGSVIAGLASSSALANPALASALFVARSSAPSLFAADRCLSRVAAEVLGAGLAAAAFGLTRP